MITLVASTMWMSHYGGMMNDYEGSEGVGVVYGAACYLSHPKNVVKRGYLSTQDEVYANRLAVQAICPRALVPSVLHATASSPAPQTHLQAYRD